MRTASSAILTVQQPFPNHNGGQIVFGPDGYLYVGLGDGGSGNDPMNNGQNLGTLLATILRIDVPAAAPAYAGAPKTTPSWAGPAPAARSGPTASAIPGASPSTRPTGDLWVGDVGQNTREEVDLVVTRRQLRLARHGGLRLSRRRA